MPAMSRKKAKGEDLVAQPRRRRQVGRSVMLFPDEEVVITARPARGATLHKYVASLGLYGLWRKRKTSIVTNRRILLGSGILRRTERSIPMTHVDDVSFLRRGLNSYAEITVNDRGSRRTEEVGPMSPRAARRFMNEVLRRI